MLPFRDRVDAGRQLAERLEHYQDRSDVLVLALPRGGVPVADQVAEALNAPLDLLLVRKLGAPGQEELAMGAIASGGIRVLNQNVIELLEIPWDAVEDASRRAGRELERRERVYRGERPRPDVRGKTVIVVDDGVATGATLRAAVEGLHQLEPARIVVAVPVAPSDSCEAFEAEADEVVCLETPAPFWGVGRWYEEFTQTSDDEVRRLLERSRRREAERLDVLRRGR